MIINTPYWLLNFLERWQDRKPPDTPPEPEAELKGSQPAAVRGKDGMFWEQLPDRVDNRGKAQKSQRKRTRPLADITAVVVHQTGFTWSLETAHQNAWKINAHLVVLPDGTVCWNHPFEAYLWAADLANRFSISIEFLGNFEGHPGKDDFWRPERFGRSRPTRHQIVAGRDLLIQLLYSSGPFPKLPLESCHAHRQFRTGKRAPKVLDPGWEVYQGINLWAHRQLGLSARAGWTLGNGAVIPPSWYDPDVALALGVRPSWQMVEVKAQA